ncbi:class I SAM-dependent methyltransferase [Treponema sp. R80B11-R83G3]
MEKYKNIKSEHQLRSLVFDDYFKSKEVSWEQEIDKIDFIITGKQSLKKNKEGGSEKHYFWAETKKSETEQYIMLTQLLLTIKKPYDKNEYIIPNYIGCFDTVKIIFVPTNLISNILHDNDIKWNITPSDIKDEYFLKIINKLKFALFNNKEVKIFTFGTQDEEIKTFIKNNILKGDIKNKFEITEDNFDRVYLKWLEKVKPSISVNWEEEKKIGLYDADFYLADLLSKDNVSIKDKLLIVLQNDHYKLIKALKKSKTLIEDDEYFFKDKQKAYNAFWSIYQRPPLPDYWDNIINRKDLLVPQDIRERKGSFFTPQIWVEKSQEYIADVFGKNWQDKYYVWDCCAGTGNLLVGINRNMENVFASTIDESDVKAMYDRIENGARLLKKNVFKFDFLNDDFKKLPKALKDIIDNPKKREKLIIYINPPYAEAGNRETIIGSGTNKSKVSASRMYDDFKGKVGNAILELSAQFMLRIYRDIPNSKLATFSTLKYISSSNFIKFRDYFHAEFKKGFVCRADTFDNVSGAFPIGFFIWDLDGKHKITSVKTDVYEIDNEGNNCQKIGRKSFYSSKKGKLSIDWLRKYFDNDGERIAYLRLHRNDIQNKNAVFITSKPSDSDFIKHEAANVTVNNLIVMSIYCTIRFVIVPTWLNNKDNFQFPNDKWETDLDFQNDCFMYVLFDNNIQSAHGVNHWIPFSETEVNARGNFESHFMQSFIKGKIIKNGYSELFEELTKTHKPIKFSKEAQSVFEAGRELWSYYHSKSRVNINSSFYDIREYFQGVSNGRMNNKSDDEEYNNLIGNLREKMKILAKKIEPKVYEYGFLLE